MTEEIKTCVNNQKMSVYCKTYVCKGCKQINYLEQEVKLWKRECWEAKAKSEWIYDLTRKKIDCLEQENKELKEKFKQVFNIDNQECWNIAFLNDEKYKYRSALEEIRKITEEDRNCMNSEIACCQLCDKLDLIKDKINEVLN